MDKNEEKYITELTKYISKYRAKGADINLIKQKLLSSNINSLIVDESIRRYYVKKQNIKTVFYVFFSFLFIIFIIVISYNLFKIVSHKELSYLDYPDCKNLADFKARYTCYESLSLKAKASPCGWYVIKNVIDLTNKSIQEGTIVVKIDNESTIFLDQKKFDDFFWKKIGSINTSGVLETNSDKFELKYITLKTGRPYLGISFGQGYCTN
jgi:hypothetical protein